MTTRTMKDDLVGEATARALLSRVNLLAESGSLAIDIGGNLAKLLYLQRHAPDLPAPTLPIDRLRAGAAPPLSVAVPALGGTLHFFAFETRAVETLVAFIRAHWPPAEGERVRATGGGAYKYSALLRDKLGVALDHVDELASAVAGLNFALQHVHGEVYEYDPPSTSTPRSQMRPSAPPGDCRRFVARTANPFPYLLVNIGSGVSVVKVVGHGRFERISGSALGGGTFWGLARLLLNCSTFDDVIALTNRGDHSNVDMLVGDIYGGAYASLDAGVIAASFGKVTMSPDDRHPPVPWHALARKRFWRALRNTLSLWLSFLLALPIIAPLLRLFGVCDPFASRIANFALAPRFQPEDVAISLLRMVAYNVGQIAILNARLHGLERIYFGGNFIRNHPHTVADIAFAVDFWSQGGTQALFLKHDGYLGAIGAFIGGESQTPAKHVGSKSRRESKISRAQGDGAASVADRAQTSTADVADRAPAAVVQHAKQAANGSPTQNGSSSKSKSVRARKARARAAAASDGAHHANGVANGVKANGVKAANDVKANGDSQLFYDDNSDEAYREALAGEWRTVVPRGKKKT